MVLRFLTDVAYQLIESSWAAATVLIWPIVAAHLFQAYRTGSLDVEGVRSTLLENSRLTVTVMVAAGAAMLAAGFDFTPPLKVAGEVAALAYLAFLFWSF